MKMLRKILIPFVPVYCFVTWLRNIFYDYGILKSKTYNIPIICVGNLSVGGTGKTPMIEYLIRLLQTDFKVAVLSRGYKRKTKGFVLASDTSTVDDIGDEPYQFFTKFNNVSIAVDANRQNGIESLIELVNPDVILLDDAYQHRKVKAGLNILLSTYSNLFFDDMLLPTGNLREPKRGVNRADIIIITKCPKGILETDKRAIIKRLQPETYQVVLFSNIEYSNNLKSDKKDITINDLKKSTFTLVTGIANAKPLVNYLKLKELDFDHLNFKDHHDFTQKEIDSINSKSLIVTTEKDFMRLKGKISIPMYYLPIEIKLDNKELLISQLNSFLKSFKQV
jgi:tetraacyldisaccharide 4'-kinase